MQKKYIIYYIGTLFSLLCVGSLLYVGASYCVKKYYGDDQRPENSILNHMYNNGNALEDDCRGCKDCVEGLSFEETIDNCVGSCCEKSKKTNT